MYFQKRGKSVGTDASKRRRRRPISRFRDAGIGTRPFRQRRSGSLEVVFSLFASRLGRDPHRSLQFAQLLPQRLRLDEPLQKRRFFLRRHVNSQEAGFNERFRGRFQRSFSQKPAEFLAHSIRVSLSRLKRVVDELSAATEERRRRRQRGWNGRRRFAGRRLD